MPAGFYIESIWVIRLHLVSADEEDPDDPVFSEYFQVINAKHLVIRIGMNESLLSQYVSGKKRLPKNRFTELLRVFMKLVKNQSE